MWKEHGNGNENEIGIAMGMEERARRWLVLDLLPS